MTGHHRLAAIRAPRLMRFWARIDHALYIHRYGHAGPSSGQDWARLHAMNLTVVDGAVADGERQTVRKATR